MFIFVAIKGEIHMTNDEFKDKMTADLAEAQEAGNTEVVSTLETALALWEKMNRTEKRAFRRDYDRRRRTAKARMLRRIER